MNKIKQKKQLIFLLIVCIYLPMQTLAMKFGDVKKQVHEMLQAGRDNMPVLQKGKDTSSTTTQRLWDKEYAEFQANQKRLAAKQKKFNRSLFKPHPLSMKHPMPFNKTKNTDHAIVFISFSMPDASIKAWVKQAHQLDIPVVIQGLIDNSFKKTVATLQKVIGDAGGVELNPMLFTEFSIQRVPALIVTDQSLPLLEEGEHYKKNQFDVITGDVTLHYALNKIATNGQAGKLIAQQLLDQLRTSKEGKIN